MSNIEALKKHVLEEIRIVQTVMRVGNTDDKTADWYRAKIIAAEMLLDALGDELAPTEQADDF